MLKKKRVTSWMIVLCMIATVLFGVQWVGTPVVQAAEIIVDNADAGFTTGGTWTIATSLQGFYGTNYVHDGTSSADASSKWAMWKPNIPASGNYEIYMRWVTNGTYRPDAAPLEIVYNGGVDTSKTVDQTLNHATWVLIGTYNLTAGTGNSVKILATDAGYTIADAVKFVSVASATPTPTPTITPTPTPTPQGTLKYTVIIDNTDSGFSSDLAWTVGSTAATGYYGGNFLHDGTSTANPSTRWAKWTPNLRAQDDYKLYMWWAASTNRPDAAPIEIQYNGGLDSSKTVNQQINGGQWAYIGTYNLTSGTSNYLKIIATDAGYTVADAVMFEAVNTYTLMDPTNLTATAAAPTLINLTWTDNASDEDGYKIYRRVVGDTSWLYMGSTPANSSSFQSVGLLENIQYEHKIVAYNSLRDGNDVVSTAVTTLDAGNTPRGSVIAPIGSGNPRNGEGGITKLNNGNLMFVYGRYTGAEDLPVGTDIACKISTDGGVTWQAERILFENPTRGLIQPALVRMANGYLGISYSSFSDHTEAYKVFRYSTDEGTTWSNEIMISDATYSYITGTHDRLYKLSNGRLIQVCNGKGSIIKTMIFVSDNNGLTWVNKTGDGLSPSSADPMWEADLVEVSANNLLMYGRTRLGWIYKCVSSDNGNTWSQPVQTVIRYSISPPKLYKIPGTGTLVFIGCGYNYKVGEDFCNGRRIILSSQVSYDAGQTWQNYKEIEYDGGVSWYHYASVHMDSSYAYMTYYKGNDTNNFGPAYYVRLPINWFTTTSSWPY